MLSFGQPISSRMALCPSSYRRSSSSSVSSAACTTASKSSGLAGIGITLRWSFALGLRKAVSMIDCAYSLFIAVSFWFWHQGDSRRFSQASWGAAFGFFI